MLTPTRSGLFLAISALLASTALHAQDTPTPAEPQPQAAQSAQPAQLDAIQVRGRFIPQPMLQTSEVASFVTREDFQRSGDDTAAAALGRVSGLTVAKDKYVFVRGLNERYSNAMLNGSPLPSPEPMQRVVPLDLFPAEVLQGVTVQKTYSAKYPGEFGGGVIDMQALTIPNRNFFSISVGGGGNSVTTGERGLTYFGSDTDFWGYDDGTRKMPAALQDAIATGQRVDLGNFSREDIRRIGRSFENANVRLLQEKDSINPDVNFGFSGGYTMDIGEEAKLGFIAVAGFDNQWRSRFGKQQEGFFQNSGVLELDRNYDFFSTQNEARVNVLLGAGWQAGSHRLGLTTLYVHNTQKEARSRAGTDILFSASPVRDDYTEWFERDLISHQLSGSHGFGEYDDLKIEWRLAHSKARRNVPYENSIRFEQVERGYWSHDGSRQQNTTRFGNVEDMVASGGVDVTWRLPLEERDVILSGGVAYSDNDRNAWAREFRFLALDGALPFYNRYQRPDYLFSDYNLSQDLLRLRETTGGFGAAAYDATLKVAAAYLQAEVEFNPTLRATVGVRGEKATQAVHPYDIFSGVRQVNPEPLRNTDWLPGATVTWNFAENQQIRFGASKTLARPQFREMAPQQYSDPDSDRLFYGNPHLVNGSLVNLDVRYEWFFQPGEHLVAALFHKSIDKPVEANINEAGGTIFQSFLNAPAATLYGVELELKKYLTEEMTMPLLGNESRLFLSTNYTWSQSEIHAKDSDTVHPYGYPDPQPATLFVRNGVAMQGHSEHVANLQFGLENRSGSQAMLMANFASDRITARGRPGQPDYMERPGTTLDLVLRKAFAIGDTNMKLSFSARNLLNTEYREFQSRQGNTVDVYRYKPGISWGLSLSASF